LVELWIAGRFWNLMRWSQENPKGWGWRCFSLGIRQQVGGDRKIPQGMGKEL